MQPIESSIVKIGINANDLIAVKLTINVITLKQKKNCR